MRRLLSTSLMFVCLLGLLFTSCMERKTNDPQEAYRLWAGEPAPDNVKVLHGSYWQSAHWSKEYVLYLEVTAPKDWRQQFIIQNNLIPTNKEQAVPTEAPDWFRPGKQFRRWISAKDIEGSAYYEDTLTGKLFIYEIQL
jgi:hypothetical protein